MAETKERILDTAERLFAERGYGATSLRSIIAAAGVNLAAVHYHYRNKEALLDAVLKRHLEPVNRERLAMLDEYEREAGDGNLPVERVLAAFIAPPLRLARHPAHAGFVKLMGRIVGDGDASLIRRHFGEIMERFLRAFRRANPDLAAEEVLWRAFFSIAVLAHTLLGNQSLIGIAGEATTERLVAFLAAGFRAPVAAESRTGS
jgi:AcrR family transcriptional regulator